MNAVCLKALGKQLNKFEVRNTGTKRIKVCSRHIYVGLLVDTLCIQHYN